MEGPNAEEKEPHYGANYWLDKEIPVFVELVEPDNNNPAFAQYAGLEIFGNWSRVYAKKSVAITFREKHGDKRLYYPLFPEFPELKIFKSFILRNFGNSFGHDYLRDRLASSLSEGLGVDYQRGRYAIVYYNGKYFGLHDLRERSNEYYFETHYGINHNSINLLKANNSVSAGKADDYIALMDWLKIHSLDIDSNYAYIASKIDLDNYINYMQVEIFANNLDWPGNNQKKWNSPNIQDQWKWFLYDLDFGFGYVPYKETNIFDYALAETKNGYQNNPVHTFLFRNLMRNGSFKAAFINRMATLLHMNFKEDHILFNINKMMNEIQSEISRDQHHWSLSASKMGYHLEAIRRFANIRHTIIVDNLQEHFQLSESIPITITKEGNGIILLHNLPIQSLPITINFFKDFPVTISAKPLTNQKWSHWSDGDTNSTRTIHPQEAAVIKAIFK